MSDETENPLDRRGRRPPASISAAARDSLLAMIALEVPTPPPAQTVEEWEERIAFSDRMLLSMLAGPAEDSRIEPVMLGGVAAFDVVPQALSSAKVCLYLHGGALIMGGGDVCRAMAASFAQGTQMRTIGLDYRMPPRFPFPTPLNDCVTAYRALLEDHAPEDVIVAGVSGGGNLAAAMTVRIRDLDLPMPIGVVLLSPEVDLTESGDSFETLMGIDPVLRTRLTDTISLYAGGHDLADPLLSPLFADLSAGFPQTFLQCGTRDLFLSNTVRFHRALRRAKVPAELHVFEAMPHGGFGSMLEGGLGNCPEDQEVYIELRRFLSALA
ncbi:alpha/beta hydrolase [Novosphingobium sp. G106]|uniref:alpha/beta hydrolase n=1 Tax=Novosphingobium sp. G106 TaxID=2849500 RepID=UPI001C2D9CC8|nr:alpha/beta hydrolase [Novosphingobium sp. G106]MBV1688190.1 alpha/beta hydrolase [Novosphingobium sp. G106]